MGLMDTAAKILLKVEADVSTAKTNLKGLGDSLKDLKQPFGELKQAAEIAMEGLEAYGHRLDLNAATAGISIDKLRTASKGLKTDIELLEHAAAFNTGTFKLTENQMATVEKAMYALEERGKSSTEVWSAMEAALTQGSIKPLKSLGIVIDDTNHLFDANGDKLTSYGKRQEALSLIMKELAKTSKEAEGAQVDQADAVQQQLVSLKNSWEVAKEGLGKIVVALTPVIAGLAQAVSHAMHLIDILPKGPGGGGVKTPGLLPNINSGDTDLTGGLYGNLDNYSVSSLDTGSYVNRAISAATGATGTYGGYGGAMKDFANSKQSVGINKLAMVFAGAKADAWGIASLQADLESSVDALLSQKKKGGKATGATSVAQALGLKGIPIGAGTQGRGGGALGAIADSTSRDEYGAEVGLQKILDDIQKASDTTKLTAMEDAHARRVGLLEKIVGPIEQFDMYGAAFDKLGGVFGAFSNAVGGAYEAIVTGQGSVSAAFKHILADGLMAVGKSSAIDALRETALGFGSLALGPLGGASASMHFQAAAMHAAVAVAAGVAAHSIGTSAQGAAADKAAAAQQKEEEKAQKEKDKKARSGSSDGGGSRGRDVIIAYLDPWAQQTESERGRNARKMAQKVLGPESGTDS